MRSRRILQCSGYRRDEAPATATARVGAMFLFAIETAMRAGEVCGLRWQDVDIDRNTAEPRENAAARREVPLSSEAIRILQQAALVIDSDSVFRVGTASLDALFPQDQGPRAH